MNRAEPSSAALLERAVANFLRSSAAHARNEGAALAIFRLRSAFFCWHVARTSVESGSVRPPNGM